MPVYEGGGGAVRQCPNLIAFVIRTRGFPNISQKHFSVIVSGYSTTNDRSTRDSVSAEKSVGILHTARIDADAVIVDFADDTSAIFTSEQLLSLIPERLKTEFEPPQDWGGFPQFVPRRVPSSATKWRNRLLADVS
jgi:hypothetical protein